MVKKSSRIQFSENRLKILNTYATSHSAPHNHVQRAKILISLHNCENIETITVRNLCSTSTISRIKRKVKESVQNSVSDTNYILYLLKDRTRTGRPSNYKIEHQDTILSIHCKGPKEFDLPGASWTYRRLVDFLRKRGEFPRLSISYISKLNKKRKIVPYKVRYYLTSKDPQFASKRDNICQIYRELREGNLENKEVFSVDEKTHIQALKNIREDMLPTINSRSQKNRLLMRFRDPEYKRMGNTNLIAATNLKTGKTYGQMYQRNRSEEFFDFLEHLNRIVDPLKVILIIADNYKTHSSKKLIKSLKLYPGRFEFEFIPTHCSWMNPVEGTFSKLQRGYLRNLRVDSLDDLKNQITKSIKDMNNSARPANWDNFIQRYFNK